MIYGKLAEKIMKEQEMKISNDRATEVNILNETVVYGGNGLYIAPYCSPDRSYSKDAYFKVFNNESERKSTMIARIKLFDTKYAKKHEKGNENKELWVLNTSDRKKLQKALESKPNKNGTKCNTVYEEIIDQFRNTDPKFNESNVPKDNKVPDYVNGLKGEKYED